MTTTDFRTRLLPRLHALKTANKSSTFSSMVAAQIDTMAVSTSAPSEPSTKDDVEITVVKRHPVPRKGHKKSRVGCLVCKKRKTKCDEAKPRCKACVRLGLACCYGPHSAPTAKRSSTPSSSSSGSSSGIEISRSLRAEGSTFTLSDLGYFQYFLCTAYPTLPIGKTDVWQQVGQMVHQYEFLAHAALGLGASNLALANGQRQIKEGLDHRVTSIGLLNTYLKRDCHSPSDIDAVLAASMCLAYQSGFMDDGLIDYISFLRGCYIVTTDFVDMKVSIFQDLSHDVYSDGALQLLPIPGLSLDQPVTRRFQLSLDRIGPLCSSPMERQYLAALHRAAAFSLSLSPDSWREHSYLWMNFGKMTNEQFSSFIDPENYASRILIMHFAFLEFVMSWKTIGGVQRKHFAYPRVRNWVLRQNVHAHWVQQVQSELPKEYKQYGQWVADLTKESVFVSGVEIAHRK